MTTGVIQWGCSACVEATIENQREKNPSLEEDGAGELAAGRLDIDSAGGTSAGPCAWHAEVPNVKQRKSDRISAGRRDIPNSLSGATRVWDQTAKQFRINRNDIIIRL